MTENFKIECPRCRQGWVEKVRVGYISQDLQICFECEAIWPIDAEPKFADFQDLSVHVRSMVKSFNEREVYGSIVNI